MRKQVTTLMPWCEACQCFHDGEHIANVQRNIRERIRAGELKALAALIQKYPAEARAILEGDLDA